MAKANQEVRLVILGTGSCVSCIDEILLRKNYPITPVQVVDVAMKEPAEIICQTHITLDISPCVMTFHVIVAKFVTSPCEL